MTKVADVIKNNAVQAIGILWLAQAFAGVFGFAAEAILARSLSTTEYGALAVAMKSINLISPLAAFGVGAYWLRCFGKEGWTGFRWIPGSLRLVYLSTLITLTGLIVWAWLGGPDPTVRPLLFWLSGFVIAQAALGLASAAFQLQNQYGRLAAWHVIPHLGRLAVALVALCLGLSIDFVAQGYLLTALFTLGCSAVVIARFARGKVFLYGHGKPPERLTSASATPGMFEVAHGTWPFALAGVFYLVYFQSDLIILAYMRGPDSSAIYNVAVVVLTAVYMLPSVIYQKFLLPHLHRWAEHDRKRFFQVYHVGNGLMLASGIIIGASLALVGPWLITTIFGINYVGAGGVLAVLCIGIPFHFLASSVGATLVTGEHMRKKVWCQGAVAVINVGLNLLLIPQFGVYGAAIATAVSEAALLVIYFSVARRQVFSSKTLRGETTECK